MTIILPKPPSADPNSENISTELQVQRDLTEWMIAANLSVIKLNPVRRQPDNTGGFMSINLPSRPPQEFRLITMSATQKPVVTEDGIEREIDLTLLGKWDSEVDVYDWWTDGEGLRYEVVEIVPYNRYEVRALVIKSGHG